MESINFEKKQVTLLWKSSWVVLARCDDAYQGVVGFSVVQQKEQEIAVEAEKEAFCKAITWEKQKIVTMMEQLANVERQLKMLLKKVERVVDNRLAIQSQFGKYWYRFLIYMPI